MYKQYQTIWQQGMAAYEQRRFSVDKGIGCVADTRRGITLLARLSQPIKDKTSQFLTELNHVCPDQYCYPQSDMHVTIMSIVSCKDGFLFNKQSALLYFNAISQQLKGVSSLMLDFSGITASDAAVLLTGYTEPTQLAQLRADVRTAILNSGLSHSMDSRYEITTAHSTILRYRTQPQNNQALIQFLKANQDREFGAMQLESLELVFNDWYQTETNTRLVGRINLENN